MGFSWLSDDELRTRASEALDAAHNYPMRAYRVDHDGHRWIEDSGEREGINGGGSGWPRASDRWIELSDEMLRRGIS